LAAFGFSAILPGSGDPGNRILMRRRCPARSDGGGSGQTGSQGWRAAERYFRHIRSSADIERVRVAPKGRKRSRRGAALRFLIEWPTSLVEPESQRVILEATVTQEAQTIVISSRTPEGKPFHCPVCGSGVKIEPSQPMGDVPCPRCGHLLWLTPGLSRSPRGFGRAASMSLGRSRRQSGEYAVWPRYWAPLPPGVAALLGVAIGWAVAIVCAFLPPRDFSCSFLLILLLSIGPFGGTFGYILWLLNDPTREVRFRRITGFVAISAIAGLLIAFPSSWWHMGRSMGPHWVWMSMGFICSMAMFAVGAGMGIVHLAGHVASSFRQSTKSAANSWTSGVWDRELDQG
jgi:hypothetical protein